MSDIHGEYEAFCHIMNNCSGVIREKVHVWLGQLSAQAAEVYNDLLKHFAVDFDETGSIGKRYRREDEIGTPLCITYDFDSENDHCVTVRDRDTTEQVRVKINEL